MARLNKLEPLVKKVLEEYPDTRNDDDILIFRVYKEINEDAMIRELFCEILLNRKKYNLPSYKSIERCRRKLQATYEHLQAEEKVKDIRLNETSDYINYAIDGYESTFIKMIENME